jgi:hypothetical protein
MSTEKEVAQRLIETWIARIPAFNDGIAEGMNEMAYALGAIDDRAHDHNRVRISQEVAKRWAKSQGAAA